MKYIIIPTKDKSERNFFLGLFKKMHKEVIAVSSAKMEALPFLAALKEAEQSGKGSHARIKNHLSKITSGK